ncbi:MAG: hypothetical protein V2J55_01195 [Candidatus Competibacteraceae bacterium]|nr:hypothetical protein [Candidatus Competibacteraceae bacterium]
MNTIVRDTSNAKRISVLNTGYRAAQPIAGSVVVADTRAQTPAQIAQEITDIPNYRFSREPIDPPVEAQLYHAGEYAGSGKICSIGIHGMFLETTGTFAKDMYGMYVQVQFALPGDQDYSRFCLDGRVAHSFDTGVAVLMDVLYPVTRRGLDALVAQATQSAGALH